jgi:hypothetical protein
MAANIHHRDSIARIYPREAYAQDRGANSDPKTEVLRGVRILSGADGAGNFTLQRAARHVGEVEDAGETVFLSPFMVTLAVGADTADEYEAFLDRVIAAAQAVDVRRSPGPGEERLQGPRQ